MIAQNRALSTVHSSICSALYANSFARPHVNPTTRAYHLRFVFTISDVSLITTQSTKTEFVGLLAIPPDAVHSSDAPSGAGEWCH